MLELPFTAHDGGTKEQKVCWVFFQTVATELQHFNMENQEIG